MDRRCLISSSPVVCQVFSETAAAVSGSPASIARNWERKPVRLRLSASGMLLR
ncbi:unannotated protein [freshwater metagenome]|uniref:Unannotated protein n=1 Tax=freshwater metagenome TaxID=449393 RepID=A0A6J7AVG5_9ZZZZ